MQIKTINGIEYVLIPLDDIRNLKMKPEVLDMPSYEEFKKYALENKPSVDLSELSIKYKAWKENRWSDGNGKKIKNWKSKLLNTLPYLKAKEVTGRQEKSEVPKDYGEVSPTAITRQQYLKGKKDLFENNSIGKE